MSSIQYHLSVCFPYDTKNPIETISKNKGFTFVNLPLKVNGDNHYRHIRKLIWVLDYLETNQATEDNVVMFTDAHDVLVLADASEMYARFLRQDCDLLFSAEKLFSPHNDRAEPYRLDVKRFFETGEGDYAPYPNSGCWIGWGWAAKAFLRVVVAYALDRGDDDDQRVVQDTLFHGGYGDLRVKLDTRQEVFVSVIANGDDVRLLGNKIYYKDRPESIGVFHANGYKKAIEFVDLYNNVFYATDNPMLDLRCIRVDGDYLGFAEGRFHVSARFGDNSLLALVKAGRRCCLVTTRGDILSFVPDTTEVRQGRLMADVWEICRIDELDATLSHSMGEPVTTRFDVLVLNDLWGYLRHGIHDDLIKYSYNL